MTTSGIWLGCVLSEDATIRLNGLHSYLISLLYRLLDASDRCNVMLGDSSFQSSPRKLETFLQKLVELNDFLMRFKSGVKTHPFKSAF